jgi:hypothetical protein
MAGCGTSLQFIFEAYLNKIDQIKFDFKWASWFRVRVLHIRKPLSHQ